MVSSQASGDREIVSIALVCVSITFWHIWDEVDSRQVPERWDSKNVIPEQMEQYACCRKAEEKTKTQLTVTCWCSFCCSCRLVGVVHHWADTWKLDCPHSSWLQMLHCVSSRLAPEEQERTYEMLLLIWLSRLSGWKKTLQHFILCWTRADSVMSRWGGRQLRESLGVKMAPDADSQLCYLRSSSPSINTDKSVPGAGPRPICVWSVCKLMSSLKREKLSWRRAC